VAASADLPVEPLSDHYGSDRGKPLDRHYIEAFLAERRDAVRGSVLEVEDDAYTTAFGGDRVTMSTVVDMDDTNQRATRPRRSGTAPMFARRALVIAGDAGVG
jgi:hypothetical protein